MPSKRYIVVEFGIPRAVDTMPDLPRMNRLAILGRTWDRVHAFDSSSRYRWHVVDPPPVGMFSQLMAHTVYNPMVDVRSEWLRCGEYNSADLIALITDGLSHDDDIIQQWFSAEDVTRLLTSANSWDEMVLAIEAIGGSHEADSEVSKYVARALMSRSDVERS